MTEENDIVNRLITLSDYVEQQPPVQFEFEAAEVMREAAEEIKGLRKEERANSFQERTKLWMIACFGQNVSNNTVERRHRFFEEAAELLQACGGNRDEAIQLIDYVFSRDIGEKDQEVGGVMITLAGLCLANSLNMHDASEVELERVWNKIDVIRHKQMSKPKFSVLPIDIIKKET